MRWIIGGSSAPGGTSDADTATSTQQIDNTATTTASSTPDIPAPENDNVATSTPEAANDNLPFRSCKPPAPTPQPAPNSALAPSCAFGSGEPVKTGWRIDENLLTRKFVGYPFRQPLQRLRVRRTPITVSVRVRPVAAPHKTVGAKCFQ
jgi:hypothetical protein